MNAKPLLSRSDIRPIEFSLAVVLGGIGSALLSGLVRNPWVSVVFAATVMIVMALLRWRIASEFKDYQSIESFAEDVYLLGYLLTLAALLGLAPRLMQDETNLFHVAGVKLCTTILGLGLMMVFRQIGRRWAAEGSPEETERFLRQEEIFRAAVGRLNDAASQLTAKMEDVTLRFDPDLLGPVADWSNRAANAFSTATRALGALPPSVEAGIQRLAQLSTDLDRTKAAIAELTHSLTTNGGPAVIAFSKDLAQAGASARTLSATVATLEPAVEGSRESLEKLGTQTVQEIKRFDEINSSLMRVAVELGNVHDTMKKLATTDAKDPSAPMNRLVQALEATGERASASSERIEKLTGKLHDVATASQELSKQIGVQVREPLQTSSDLLQRVHDQLTLTVTQIGQLTQQIQSAASRNGDKDGVDKQLLSKVGELQRQINETNGQLLALNKRIDGAAGPELKRGILSRLFGSSNSGSGDV